MRSDTSFRHGSSSPHANVAFSTSIAFSGSAVLSFASFSSSRHIKCEIRFMDELTIILTHFTHFIRAMAEMHQGE